MTRPGDPLQLPEEPTRRASARIHLASYESLEAFFADQRRTRRLHWAAVIAATVALVLVAFAVGLMVGRG